MKRVRVNAWKYEVTCAYDGAARAIRLRKCWKKYAIRKARYAAFE